MAKIFRFRLQKVLEFRAERETAAKNAYLGKRSEVLAAEASLAAIRQRRLDTLSEPRSSLEAYKLLEVELMTLDDKERAQNIVLNVLNDEAEALRVAWTRHKQDLETVVKLRERAVEEWSHEVERQEQSELDEWSVLRRVA